jgi:hypothetical protein
MFFFLVKSMLQRPAMIYAVEYAGDKRRISGHLLNAIQSCYSIVKKKSNGSLRTLSVGETIVLAL